MHIQQPATSIKLTNVSIVKLKKKGKRFEIACYKNKVLEYRNNIEQDIDNVLQIKQVFINVSKGQVASNKDLLIFEKPLDDIILEILMNGQVQIGEKERTKELETLNKSVATIIADKCVNPETKRPYTVSIIEKTLDSLHFNINPKKQPKQQALEAIKFLQDSNVLPITRAQMRVTIIIQDKEVKRIYDKIHCHLDKIESLEKGQEWEIVLKCNIGSVD
jgi:ribosome maturation protein SDO1